MLRAASGLTQEAFSELAGMDYKTYQHIEAGRRPSVRICTVEKICSAYGIELWQFFLPKAPEIPAKKLKRARSAKSRAAKEK